MRIYLATPRLRGLLAVTLAAASASAMVIVNTVVVVRGQFGLSATDVAFALAAYGGGSILAALALPRLLERLGDRPIMIGAAVALGALLAVLAAVSRSIGEAQTYWPSLLAGWFALGLAYSCAVTPGGRLLRRSASTNDRPAVFAAQFALSHVCWLIAYPLAGWLGAGAGITAAFTALAALAATGAGAAAAFWPRYDPEAVPHTHDLPPEHPHLHGGDGTHSHAFVIDDVHQSWPK
jgi:MFS family permease